MARVVYLSSKEQVTDREGRPSNVFWRWIQQVGTVVTAFADLDGNANDISEGDVNRFKEIADLVVTRDGSGFISTVAKNGKTTTVTRDGSNMVTQVQEVIDSEPSKVTTQTIIRDGSDFLEQIDVEVLGF